VPRVPLGVLTSVRVMSAILLWSERGAAGAFRNDLPDRCFAKVGRPLSTHLLPLSYVPATTAAPR